MIANLNNLAVSQSVCFGTSGVRGLVADMTDEICYAYAQAFLNAIAVDAQQIVVGHDLRPSSPRIAAACIRAITDSGREAVFVGALPTPALANYCAICNAPGIIVTGSHIPFDRNGIKFYRADGEIDKSDEQAILNSEVQVPADLSLLKLPPVCSTALEAYIERYVSFFGVGGLAGKRIALYEHSSVARDVLRCILEKLGAEVISLGRTDTFVPIDTEAVRQEDIRQARAWAQEHRFDAILSTDGDADRPLIGDENGIWMRGDLVGILCAQYLQADEVVTPVSSNTAVEKCGSFAQVTRTKIGSPYVIAGMRSTNSGATVVGYEANGGFLLGSQIKKNGALLDALPTRDSILPMLALLFMAKEKGVALSHIGAELPRRFTASDRIQQVSTEAGVGLINELMQNTKKAEALMAPDSGCVVAQGTMDGLRLTFESGDVVHLRQSGNAPELRCYAESDAELRAHGLCEACLKRIAACM